MTTGKQLLEAGFVFEGQRYSTDSGRTNPNSNYKDCSGFTYATHVVATGKGFPAGATVSTAQENACRYGGGRQLTRDEAVWMPGAICFIWGFGAKGHVELSAGDGRHTYGTPSDIRDPNARDVGYTPWDNNAWETYWTIPGITYDGSEEDPLATFTAEDIVRLAMWGTNESIKQEDEVADRLTTFAKWGVGEALKEPAGKLLVARIVLDTLESEQGQRAITKAVRAAMKDDG